MVHKHNLCHSTQAYLLLLKPSEGYTTPPIQQKSDSTNIKVKMSFKIPQNRKKHGFTLTLQILAEGKT
jgi:hypothetical protein